MAAYIKLKSKAASIADLSGLDISRFLPAFTPDEARLQKDMQRQLSRHGRKEACATVQAGDMVLLSCRSGNEKYCKAHITVPVGKGLFSAELEEKLIGLPVGQQTDLRIGEAAVTVWIEKAERTVLPELNDETVASWGMDGIASVADLRRACIDRQIDGLLLECEEADRAAAFAWNTVAENSCLILDEQEVAGTRTEAEEKLEQMGIAKTDTQMCQMVYTMFLNNLRMAAIGQKMAENAGQLLTEADYQAYLQRNREASPDRTESELLAKYTREEFAKYQYSDNAAVMLDRFVAKSFKQALNP